MVTALDIKDLDLGKSGIIEASAGTGKTYTICTIVSRIIREGRAAADQIAVVTFTEKAAGELKQRIVKRLEDDLENAGNKNEADNLKNALSKTDEIRIGTIHGFCNGLLREFSFENGAPFQLNSNSDLGLLDRLLNLQIRRDWQKMYGDLLPTLLKASDFINNPEAFIKAVKEIEKKLYAFVDCGNRSSDDSLAKSCKTIPEVQNADDLSKKWEELKNNIQAIKNILPHVNNEANSDAYKENGKKIHGATLKAIKSRITSMIEECQKEITDIDLEPFAYFSGKYDEKLSSCDAIADTQSCLLRKEIVRFQENYETFS